jgi:hypothetical protein
MGAHDQTLDKDAHRSIHDDGRKLPPIRHEEYVPQYDDYANPIPNTERLPYYAHQAFLFRRPKALVPEIVYVHGDNFTPTDWEREFSNLTGSGDEQSFAPVVDDNFRVVGHLGWIEGTNICVPKKTIAEGHDYPYAAELEKARLLGVHRRLVSSYYNPLPRFPGQPVSAAPTKRPAPCWPANKPPALSLSNPKDEEALWNSLLEAPGKDSSEEQRQLGNLNFFLAGGGEAIVGLRFGWNLVPSEQWGRTIANMQVGPGQIYPYETYSWGYRFQVLVAPDGHIQAVLGVEKYQPERREEKILRIAFKIIDIALTVWMIIDIATIPVVLFRLGGELLARDVIIEAVKMTVNPEAKAAADVTAREVAEAAFRRGAMSGPEQAEAASAVEAAADGASKTELRGVTSELRPATEEEFGAGARRPVSAIDRGRGARPFYGTSRNRPAAGWTFNPKVDAYVTTHDEAIAEAFRRTEVPMNEFEATKVAKTAEGKTITVEWTVKKGPNRGAQVNIDDPRIVPAMNGPQAPHVGYRTAKGEVVGHIFPKEGVLASRSRIQRP